jgi:type I restriction enzyme R subunit
MSLNESETRAEYIDPALKAVGWGVSGSKVLREHHITDGRLQGSGGKRMPAEIADYVLVYKNTKLAVIEAKRLDLSHTEGLEQAKSYAKKLGIRYTYSTNGKKIYGVDMASGEMGDVDRYPTPEELWNKTFAVQNEWRNKFAAIPFEDKGGTWQSRYYQESAINKVLEAVADRKDRILLTLATGTGKTFIAFQLAWKLFQSRWTRDGKGNRRTRILFLADRNILADQAYNSFSAFEDGARVRIDPEEIAKTGIIPKNGNIFFTIFQTFMSGANETPYFHAYPPDFFDFIIIDECHRGGANDEGNWRKILEYFSPAVQLGLTATPKRKANADTYRYFGDPVYVYSLKEGINDGFLTPFKVKQIATTLDDYTYTPDDFVIDGEIDPKKRYTESDFNRVIIIPEREEYRVKTFMNMIDQDEKTIVFCATQDHALMVRDLINKYKKSKNVDYCARVTADDGEIGNQALRDFQDTERTIPTILTTSQKLTTGVDARNVRNIVLMRPVNSMIEFKQIIGRGTRLFDGKDYFTIYDFVKAHHHFNDEEWDGEPLEPPEVITKPPKEPPEIGNPPPKPRIEVSEPIIRAKVKLADGKQRAIQHMSATTYIGADGMPMSAAQFLEKLFGALPEFFRNEDELRRIWSDPDTRSKLLHGLSEKGYGREALQDMQGIIDAKNSDLFDVLAYVAFASVPKTREERANQAKPYVHNQYTDRQEAFIQFVLSKYVADGDSMLDPSVFGELLEARYNQSISDGVNDLGGREQSKNLFRSFQQYLYAQ